MVYLAAGVVVAMVVQVWCNRRVAGQLGALARFEERLSSLTRTVELLTDTTETCFQAIAAQIEQSGVARALPAAGRSSRQRRVVGAARRGQSVAAIAREEAVAESEVCLRLQLAQQDANTKGGPHGSMRT